MSLHDTKDLPLFSYPNQPGAKVEGTSRIAAQSMKFRDGTLRAKALKVLERGPMTADEIAAACDATPFAMRPRISQLKALGLVEECLETKKNESGRPANVWRLTK